MFASIYDKTDKGREEIATRKHQLSTRLRTLLVMVDGKQSATQLLARVAALGLDESNVAELIANDYIAALPVLPEPVTVVTVQAERTENNTEHARELAQIEAIYTFFNETIKSMLGLRGFALQLKAERAQTLDDFKKLRHPYIEAILKSKGRETARSLRDRLDHLLYQGDKGINSALVRDSLVDDL
ncbi:MULTISPECIES: hypothetical protein [unclassified Undibacterium]|uniref:hypothetical protein n=1 Tax=unclassified Undibacterium TaxID=2630295 RepID=UPI002AC91B25|nr:MULTISPECIES: hypothetical protein [unclassified Undibacterium]MEB0139498.1 hypothetical protein [Undibacterium sp. CCC2.1]MEB0172393.1 hypothetical protein [Undibacterium sp. CCC1.1]MEB0175720.1 hypothetical protein [Undibacterium sp. CCC3.4]MEB0214508.1 hypothetical protein [Undibacterium sp. 5I2]WPX42903.1 hypothetical protein RHM61_16180 [Undibacterium sp. CCC3.4]